MSSPRRFAFLLALPLALPALVGCSSTAKLTADEAPITTVTVTVAPTTAAVVVGGTADFTATVTGAADTSVTWTVQEGATGGTVSAAGHYTAPATPGTYHVRATSNADDTRSATATITVTATPPPVVVTVAPTTATVVAGSTADFTATVTGATNTAVGWAVVEGATGGTVNASGHYTAPATPGTYHVRATSVADASKSATATITVTAAGPVVVTVAPTTAALDACKTQTFTATVTGSATTTVTWTVQEGATGGTVSAAGLYTAPSGAGTYHVVATSVADATKSATATITVTERIVSVQVLPGSTAVLPGGTATFTAQITTTCGTSAATLQIGPGGTVTVQ